MYTKAQLLQSYTIDTEAAEDNNPHLYPITRVLLTRLPEGEQFGWRDKQFE